MLSTDLNHFVYSTFQSDLLNPQYILFLFRCAWTNIDLSEWKTNPDGKLNDAINYDTEEAQYSNPQVYVPVHIDDDKISMQITRPDIPYNDLKSIAFLYDQTSMNALTYAGSTSTPITNQLAFVIRADKLNMNYSNYLTIDLGVNNVGCKFGCFGEGISRLLNLTPTYEENPQRNVFVIQNVQHGHLSDTLTTNINLTPAWLKLWKTATTAEGLYYNNISDINRSIPGYEINNKVTSINRTQRIGATDKWGKYIPNETDMTDLNLSDVDPNFFADDSIHTDFGLIKVI